jgi:hypothetical protein
LIVYLPGSDQVRGFLVFLSAPREDPKAFNISQFQHPLSASLNSHVHGETHLKFFLPSHRPIFFIMEDTRVAILTEWYHKKQDIVRKWMEEVLSCLIESSEDWINAIKLLIRQHGLLVPDRIFHAAKDVSKGRQEASTLLGYVADAGHDWFHHRVITWLVDSMALLRRDGSVRTSDHVASVHGLQSTPNQVANDGAVPSSDPSASASPETGIDDARNDRVPSYEQLVMEGDELSRELHEKGDDGPDLMRALEKLVVDLKLAFRYLHHIVTKTKAKGRVSIGEIGIGELSTRGHRDITPTFV